MESLENSMKKSEAAANQAIELIADKYRSLLPTTQSAPFLKEVLGWVNNGYTPNDAMHKTMTMFNIAWSDERYKTISYAFNTELNKPIKEVAEESVADDYDFTITPAMIEGAQENEAFHKSRLGEDY